MTVAKNYSKKCTTKSFCTLSDKNDTSSSQPCISRYCRPWTSYLVLGREILRWYLSDSGLTAFNQLPADQDFSGIFFWNYTQTVYSDILFLLSHTALISVIKNPSQTGCFFKAPIKLWLPLLLYYDPIASGPKHKRELERNLSRVGIRWRKHEFPSFRSTN